MIILGEPNELVNIRTRKFGVISRKPLFRFDNYGMYHTTDAKILERASTHFKIIDDIENVENEDIITEEVIAIKRTCKTCGATFTNVGDFFAHAREHKRRLKDEQSSR